jgi:hypothetical protein
MSKTVKNLIDIINGREDYEIINDYSGSFYYEGSYDFQIDFNEKTHTYGKDVLDDIVKNNIPLDAKVCIWDNDDFHSWNLTHEGFVINDENKVISLICKPFSPN